MFFNPFCWGMKLDDLWESVRGLNRVNGYSGKLRPRNDLDEDDCCLRIYVTEKVPLLSLRADEIVPSSIEDIPTDVVAIGKLTIGTPSNIGRRDVVRPLVSGIGAGNWDITTGTLGRAVKKGSEEYLPSNAHVFTDGPEKEVSDEKRTVSPGKYDGGTLENYIGDYSWHDRIFPKSATSDCPVPNAIVKTFNYLAWLSGRRSRLTSYVSGVNNQDFAVIDIAEGIEYDVDRTYDFDLEGYAFTGRLFAGSDKVTIACKAKYQLDAGYYPVDGLPVHEARMGDTWRKSGRTTFDTKEKVRDDVARVTVNYGNFMAVQRDVVILNYMSAGGDSGSDMFFNLEAE